MPVEGFQLPVSTDCSVTLMKSCNAVRKVFRLVDVDGSNAISKDELFGSNLLDEEHHTIFRMWRNLGAKCLLADDLSDLSVLLQTLLETT